MSLSLSISYKLYTHQIPTIMLNNVKQQANKHKLYPISPWDAETLANNAGRWKLNNMLQQIGYGSKAYYQSSFWMCLLSMICSTPEAWDTTVNTKKYYYVYCILHASYVPVTLSVGNGVAAIQIFSDDYRAAQGSSVHKFGVRPHVAWSLQRLVSMFQ